MTDNHSMSREPVRQRRATLADVWADRTSEGWEARKGIRALCSVIFMFVLFGLQYILPHSTLFDYAVYVVMALVLLVYVMAEIWDGVRERLWRNQRQRSIDFVPSSKK